MSVNSIDGKVTASRINAKICFNNVLDVPDFATKDFVHDALDHYVKKSELEPLLGNIDAFEQLTDFIGSVDTSDKFQTLDEIVEAFDDTVTKQEFAQLKKELDEIKSRLPE